VLYCEYGAGSWSWLVEIRLLEASMTRDVTHFRRQSIIADILNTSVAGSIMVAPFSIRTCRDKKARVEPVKITEGLIPLTFPSSDDVIRLARRPFTMEDFSDAFALGTDYIGAE